jgi:hypothetical protein
MQGTYLMQEKSTGFSFEELPFLGRISGLLS